MRHRITSFRCVEAEKKMSLSLIEHKTCNRANYRHTSPLRASGAAILDHPSRFRPWRNYQSCKSRRAEADAAAARHDRVEQRIERVELGAHTARRGIIGRWQALRL